MIRGWSRWLARLLMAGGAGLLLWAGLQPSLTAAYRRQYEAALDRARVSARAEPRGRAPTTLPLGDAVGILEIARVGLSGAVAEGDGAGVLAHAIGHLPDTPLPWEPGNSALAAHRDALFRSLKHVRSGDRLRLRTPYGDFDYRVRETLIVAADDVWVLDPSPVTMLTLISCYPFDYVGPAPQRFIVRADRTS